MVGNRHLRVILGEFAIGMLDKDAAVTQVFLCLVVRLGDHQAIAAAKQCKPHYPPRLYAR